MHINPNGRWRDVEHGDYVKDTSDKTWRVLYYDGIQATLIDRDGKRAKAKVPGHKQVAILKPTIDECAKLIMDKLGGVIIEDSREEQRA